MEMQLASCSRIWPRDGKIEAGRKRLTARPLVDFLTEWFHLCR
jgi:hypothetical protein